MGHIQFSFIYRVVEDHVKVKPVWKVC